MVYKNAMFIGFALVFFFLFTSFLAFYNSIRPPKIVSTVTPENLGFDFEDVTFKTADGITIVGWYVPSPVRSKSPGAITPSSAGTSNGASQTETKKTIILLHGYPADKGDILPAMAFLNKKYNLLLFDFRYLGRSGGTYSTAGSKEVEDLKAAAQFLTSRGIQEVGVWGFSMGGAVVLMAAPTAPEIKAIVSEASYASLDRMAPELFRLPVLRHVLGYLTGLWAKLFLGIDIRHVSPAKIAKILTMPVLIVHSKNDEVISFQHALLIQEALKNNPRAEFWFEENLIHGQLGSEYQKRIEEFFEKNL